MEKDRIIEVTNYSIEIKLQLLEASKDDKLAAYWRYVEAIAMMLNEQESKLRYDITNAFDNKIQIIIYSE